jgi:hypothetical protein
VPMTRGPRAFVSAPISVSIPRPRTEAQLLHDPAAVRIRAKVVEFLADFVHATPRGTPAPVISLSSRQNMVDKPVMEERA